MLIRTKKLLLSIIIPVYNVEPYLDRCLSTVLACHLEDCEVLLSMGDSSDSSSKICATYAERFTNIQLVAQQGTGLSNARNCALARSGGRYVLFVDSDDYVDSCSLDKLINHLRDPGFVPDVIVTDFWRWNHITGRIKPVFQIGATTPEKEGMEFLQTMLRRRQCFWNVWRYIYRRDFLNKHELHFEENRLSEDIGFTSDVFLAEPKIVFLHCPYYIYNVRRGDSLMDRPTLQRLEDTIWMLSHVIQKLRPSNFPGSHLLIARFQFEYLLNLALIEELPATDQAMAFALYRDWPSVMVGSTDPAVRLAALGLQFLGLQAASNCLYRLKRIKRWMQKYLR